MENGDSTPFYVSWQEAVVSDEKGRRAVHYYLKRSGGGRDLVVVGKVKSSKHTSYRIAVKGEELLRLFSSRFWVKPRSRREVIDWLNSCLSACKTDNHMGCRNVVSFLRAALELRKIPFILAVPSNGSPGQVGDEMDGKLGTNVIKTDEHRKGIKWLGSQWTCRKRRRHYQSFCRNGAVISAHDFVYVLAEEGKRLVAYLDDLYEDIRGNKMVVVRWFHKLDEVGFILPHNYNDREIFFSLCLQDLSIECIDGLATVLSPEHFEKFYDEATSMGLIPFMCCKQFDNDDAYPFDITRIKGYWNQEIFRKKFSSVVASEEHQKSKSSDEAIWVRPHKKIRWSKECDFKSHHKKTYSENSLQACRGSFSQSKGGFKFGSLKDSPEESPPIQDNVPKPLQPEPVQPVPYLCIGSQIEVLSQDSGIRGCWFKASIIKKHRDKLKIRYLDLKDALDDSKGLEEWILASRIATPDTLGIRLPRRTMIRPAPINVVSSSLKVGCIIDAYWNDGWWEGIVVSVELDNRMKVYLPGEKQELVFCSNNLRHSKEWFDNKWHDLKERLDVVSSIYDKKITSNPGENCGQIAQRKPDVPNPHRLAHRGIRIVRKMTQIDIKKPIRDLLKDSLVTQLRWKSYRKRLQRKQRTNHSRSPIQKLHIGTRIDEKTQLRTFEKFFVSSSLKFDKENCKYTNDPHYSSPALPPVTNLVMSR
ncbi:uncharacterized protein LOC127261647 [Andrographis paniculata]|uniref:uncharacterized protein LOC127261647 n=1 Tax=Andrographis paniculata TaxID=175694 RepID=UPI0021E935F8|nr:uncharacterized protein LOC127261647 [Andrographis paniculata]